MRRHLYETFDYLGVPYELNEPLTDEDKARLPEGHNAYDTVRVGTARIVIGMDEEEDDYIVGVLNDDGTFIKGNERDI